MIWMKNNNLCGKMWVKKWLTYSVPYGQAYSQNSKGKNGGIRF
jgi:hypothetical protein